MKDKSNSKLPTDNIMGWLLRLNITDPIKLTEIFTETLLAERNGKNMTEVRAELEERFGLLPDIPWDNKRGNL